MSFKLINNNKNVGGGKNLKPKIATNKNVDKKIVCAPQSKFSRPNK